jgi:hypothetical protein
VSRIVDPQQRLISPERNSYGRARSMLVFSQLVPHSTRAQRLVFGVGRVRARSTKKIRDLSFIHFARFAIIRRLPDHGPHGPALRHPLQLFESNYNGPFDAYIDTFVDQAPTLMDEFWATSYGFPWAPGSSLRRPWQLPLGQFKRFIHLNEFEVDHYYTAYPQATATMIDSALAVRRAHDDFRERVVRSVPAAFPAAYRAFVTEVQAGCVLPADPTTPRPSVIVGLREPNRCGRAYALTVLTPIVGSRTDALRARLQGFGSSSPLAELGDVHFARWVIIDGLYADFPGAPADPAQLPCDYLLFSVDVTPVDPHARLPGAFLRRLAACEPVRRVWEDCCGYPAEGFDDAFVDYLVAHQVRASLYYAAFPNNTVAEIKAALNVQRELVAFIQSHQTADNVALLQLRTAYLQESELWESSS